MAYNNYINPYNYNSMYNNPQMPINMNMPNINNGMAQQPVIQNAVKPLAEARGI